MLFWIVITMYSENHLTYVNTWCEQNLAFLRLNKVVLMVTIIGLAYVIGLK